MFPILGFIRYDESNATARVGNITMVARNDMHVQLTNSLTGHCSIVQSNVEAIWRRFERGLQVIDAPVNPVYEASLFLRGQFAESGDRTLDDDERVAR